MTDRDNVKVRKSRRSTRRPGTSIVPFAVVGLVLATLIGVALVMVFNTLSASRAYITAESRWSKSMHTGLQLLDQFAESGDPALLDASRRAMATPFNDRRARIALTSMPVRNADAERALIAAGESPADARSMVRMFPRFARWPHFRDAIETWEKGDALLVHIDNLDDELEALWQTGQGESERVRSIRDELQMIRESLNTLAGDFSNAVNAGARQIGQFALWAGVFLIALLALGLTLVSMWALRGIRNSEQRFWNTFEHAPVGMVLLDGDGRLLEVNDSLCEFLERGPTQLGERLLTDFCDHRDRASVAKSLKQRSEVPAPLFNLETRFLREDGSRVWGNVSLAPLEQEKRGDPAWIGVIEDVSESRGLSRELAYQAAHDQLTGLINRREFENRLNDLLRRPELMTHSHALALIDLDQFKIVNESFGHLAGDALLVRLAERLQACLREQDTLARLDGDEFGALLSECDLETARAVADRLRDAVQQFDFSWEDQGMKLSASIGLIEIGRTDSNPAMLMQRADMACHEAKEQGRNKVFVLPAGASQSDKRRREMNWVTRINEAIGADRMRFHAQLMASSSGKSWRCELLIRMLDGEGRLHTAQHFMESAERFHIARAIDRWSVPNALEQIAAYRSNVPEIEHWHINLSGQSVDCDAVLPELTDQIKNSGLDPHLLCFEITESAAIHSLDEAREFFNTLRSLGCQVALDDFGKGVSTFDYLKQLPIDLVKIDGGFVRELAHSELDQAMVRSIDEVAKIAGVETVAESVESIELAMRLRKIGVDWLQGHAIHHPQPLDDLAIPDLRLM